MQSYKLVEKGAKDLLLTYGWPDRQKLVSRILCALRGQKENRYGTKKCRPASRILPGLVTNSITTSSKGVFGRGENHFHRK